MTAPLERRAPTGSGGKPSVAGDSTVTQDYLKIVWAACEWGGAGASVTGLAKRMEVAPSTASENVARLVEEGLLVHEPYKAVTLSEEGRRRAMGMIRRHRILETYLVTRLGFGWDEVHAEAEELEHAVSERLLERLDDTETLRRLERAGIGLDSRVRIRDRGTVTPAVEGGGRRRATVIALLDEDASRGAAPKGTPEAIIPDGSLWLLA